MRWVYATKRGEMVGTKGGGGGEAAPVKPISVLMVPSRTLAGTVVVPEGNRAEVGHDQRADLPHHP